MSDAALASPRRLVLADLLPGAMVRDGVLVAAFAGFVGLSAQLVIVLPFTPVPITGQTFAVLLGGAALGWRRGAAGMVVYAVAGLAGLPWFAAHHGGAGALSLPSFGYIVGFPVAAVVVGWLASRRLDRHVVSTIVLMVLGNLVIYAFGVPWLMVALHVGLGRGLALGALPFLIGDALKVLLAAGLLPSAWRLVGRVGSSQGPPPATGRTLPAA